MIGEPTFADAILDRLVHNGYRLALDGPSMRDPATTKVEVTAAITDITSSATSTKPEKGARK